MRITRRDFIKASVATTAVLAIDPQLAVSSPKNKYDSKGLPTRVLGSTGVIVPRIAIGTGTRFCAVSDEDEAQNILEFALDNGYYYWDTAVMYGNDTVISEERLGRVLKNRRKEVFLATKCRGRGADDAKREIERSLKRLQTDRLDLLQIHALDSIEDVKEITKKNGLYDVLQSVKDEGITRLIGFSGHKSEQAMSFAAKEYDFDNMLIALNHYSKKDDKFEENAVEAAAMKKMGVMVMKVVRPRETVKNINPDDLVKYALSLKNVTGAVIGIDSIDVLKKNKEILTDFTPFDDAKMKEMRMSLNPFYRNKNLEWLLPDYHDGHLV